MDMPKGFWDDAQVLSVYTRAQAIRDGVLVDLTPLPLTRRAFTVPVACTAGVWAVLTAAPSECNPLRVLYRAAVTAPGGEGDRVYFSPDFGSGPVAMWALCGPGDDPAPVLTIMLEGED